MSTAIQGGTTTTATTNPYQFPVASYGAKGNGKIVYDGQMTALGATLTCATSTPFTSADVSKYVLVQGAGSANAATLVAQITGYISASQVTLSVAAAASVSAAGVLYGNDDTAAINAAVSAAVTYGTTHSNEAEILFSSLIYMVAGPLVQGGATKGNAQIPLPFVAMTGPKLILKFTGLPDTPTVLYGLNSTPQVSGACLVCARSDGTNNITYGAASVIGGYTPQQGAGNSVFSNVRPVFTGISVVVPYNSTYAGIDCYGCTGMCVRSVSVNAFASPSQVTNPSAGISSANRYAFGLRTPTLSNDGNIIIDNYAAYGVATGAAMSEHISASRGFCVYCYVGIQGFSDANGGSMVHASRLHYWCCEACNSQLGFLAGDPLVRLDIGTFDVDTGSGSTPYTINDPSSQGWGEIYLRGSGNVYTFNGGMSKLKVRSGDQLPGIWGSPPAVPASGTAQQNLSLRDAMVYVTGTMTAAVQINGVSTGSLLAGGYLVPSLSTITLTYASAPTWAWDLL